MTTPGKKAALRGQTPAQVLDLETRQALISGTNWKETLPGRDDRAAVVVSRLNTQASRPLANDSFLSKLEHTPGHRSRPLPIGRPKKASAGPQNARNGV